MSAGRHNSKTKERFGLISAGKEGRNCVYIFEVAKMEHDFTVISLSFMRLSIEIRGRALQMKQLQNETHIFRTGPFFFYAEHNLQ